MSFLFDFQIPSAEYYLILAKLTTIVTNSPKSISADYINYSLVQY